MKSHPNPGGRAEPEATRAGPGKGPARADEAEAPTVPSRFSLPDLDPAVERVLERWRKVAASRERGREEELRRHLLQVAETVDAAHRGDPLEGVEDALVLRRRLLELLRGELVAIWSDPSAEPPDPDRMTAALRAFEAVQAQLVPRWDEEFGVALEGPSGLELAVEVAHDFRSPLSSILFLADTLRSGGSGEVNDLQQRQLNLVYSAALSMVSMAGDVVDLGRGGRTITEREPSRFSVSEVMDSVRIMVEPMVEAKGLSLALRPPEDDVRLGYPEALRRVFLNLTTNAVKFTSEGFVEMRGRNRGDGRIEFSVRDTGPGMQSDSRGELYLPFRPFQGQSGFHFSGTGLGLTIARKLVRAMEGELRFDTQRTLGTRFHFTIPLPPADSV